MSRILPVYLLIDSSGSMYGEAINAVNEGIRSMMNALLQDPYALETVKISLITFEKEVKELFPLTSLEEVQFEDIETPKSGPTHLGEALEFFIKKYNKDITKNNKSNFSPMLFVMTDGKPSDLQLFNEKVIELKKLRFASIIGCAAGPKAKVKFLKQFADTVVFLESTDTSAFSVFFKWVSASIASGNQSGSINDNFNQLPPPPTELNIVV